MLSGLLNRLQTGVLGEMAAVWRGLELRFDCATQIVRQSAFEVVIVASLSALAALAFVAAAAVSLIALYWWTTELAGAYMGLGVIGIVLIGAAVAFGVTAYLRSNALRHTNATLRSDAETGVMAGDARNPRDPHQASGSIVLPTSEPSVDPPAISANGGQRSSIGGVIEPLAALLMSEILDAPKADGARSEDSVSNRIPTWDNAAQDAMNGAVDVIREGDRAQLIIVMAGAVFLGWLLGRESRS